MAELVPSGAAAPLLHLKQQVFIVPQRELVRYQEITGGPGAYLPVGTSSHRNPPPASTACHYPSHTSATPLPAKSGNWPKCRKCPADIYLIREGRELCENRKPMMRDPV
ncbi:hypothetical protein [Saccharothrix syringae]|uniref:Uncharacterized protein n=1 Tax=Saccharothrix syringae TaxID=103733 RepID=A0A5Q0H781_SACSY|nr:hypothetical protein [Saccharothrix syringae]QFZ21814.1 hypothetical protein EKG83_34370 [Saccharothrix syringae]